MIGILIVAHGTLGESLIHCATHVMGTRPAQLMQIGVTTRDDPALVLQQALRLVHQLDQGSGVLVLTDVYGATPGNIAARLISPGSVEGLAGVNLPMLVRALTYRNETLDVVIAKAISGGIDGVIRMPAQTQNAAAGS